MKPSGTLLVLVSIAFVFALSLALREPTAVVEKQETGVPYTRALKTNGNVDAFCISPDGSRVLVLSPRMGAGYGAIFNWPEGKIIDTFHNMAAFQMLSAAAIAPRGTQAVIATTDHHAIVRDFSAKTSTELSTEHVPNEVVRYSQDGERIYFGGVFTSDLVQVNDVIAVWHLGRRARLSGIQPGTSTGAIQSVRFASTAPIGVVLASHQQPNSSQKLLVYDLERLDAGPQKVIALPKRAASLLAVSASGRLAVVADGPSLTDRASLSEIRATIMDLETGREIFVLAPRRRAALIVQFTQDELRLFIAIENRISSVDIARLAETPVASFGSTTIEGMEFLNQRTLIVAAASRLLEIPIPESQLAQRENHP